MKIFRPLNIGITALVVIVFWFVTQKMVPEVSQDSTFLNSIYIISSCLIASAAYLINDYYDQKIDAVNHPEKKYPFTQKTTWITYLICNLVAIGLGFFAFQLEFAIVFLLMPIWGLWFYSFMLKRVALAGNIAISIMAIWLPLGVVLLNVPEFHLVGQESLTGVAYIQFEKYKSLIFLLISCSFLTTFSREIVKDIQDEKGDKAMNCRTFPILVGKQFALICAAALMLVTTLIWGNFTFKNFETAGFSIIPFVVTLVFLVAGLFAMFYGNDWSKRTKWSSLLIKLSMVSALVAGMFF